MAHPATHDLEALRTLVLAYLKPWKVSVYLFGSHANGNVTELSDIDIAVLPKGPVPIDWLSGLRERIENSRILRPVDVLDLSTAALKWRRRIQREGVLWSD